MKTITSSPHTSHPEPPDSPCQYWRVLCCSVCPRHPRLKEEARSCACLLLFGLSQGHSRFGQCCFGWGGIGDGVWSQIDLRAGYLANFPAFLQWTANPQPHHRWLSSSSLSISCFRWSGHVITKTKSVSLGFGQYLCARESFKLYWVSLSPLPHPGPGPSLQWWVAFI